MNFSYVMYIGLEYAMASPKKLLSSFVLYRKNFGRLESSDGFIFGHYSCPKLKSSEIFCK